MYKFFGWVIITPNGDRSPWFRSRIEAQKKAEENGLTLKHVRMLYILEPYAPNKEKEDGKTTGTPPSAANDDTYAKEDRPSSEDGRSGT